MSSRGFTQPLQINAGVAPLNIPGLPVWNSDPVSTACILETT